MEVDAASFPHQLLDILVNISEADFVSFDLELSGIANRLPNHLRVRPSGRKQTLEERYEETRTAANRYQVLQVGITCARFDYIDNSYILRPYNIVISPLLPERFDIKREICFQSGTASFLLSQGFDMGAPFARGVPYLSREEADRAKQMAFDRFDKKTFHEDVKLKDDDIQSLDFVRRVREAIVNWETTTDIELYITTYIGLPNPPANPAISGFEKRLVHQLVRNEFPDLITKGRQECITIVRFEEHREAEHTRKSKSRAKEQIAQMTGFRLIFEALAQGDIHGADPFRYNGSVNGNIIAANSPDVKDRFDRTQERLRTRQPVLVGHNMFTDLVYFYRTFVGELPGTLSGFCRAIHKLFPRIIDTKYLATYTEGDLQRSPTLQQIAESLKAQPLPKIATHQDHPGYDQRDAFHEAGYDSLLTATVALRLSAKLSAERQGHNVQPPVENEPEGFFMSNMKALMLAEREKVKKKSKTKQQPSNTDLLKDCFGFTNPFIIPDSGDNISSSEEKHESLTLATENAAGPSTSSWQDERYNPDTSSWAPIETVQREPMELIPAFDSEFWNEFGNTLRIFGTKEAMLRIADWEVKH